MTLLASLFANRIVPSFAAMGPSALLPSHDQTTFQFWPAAITSGMADDAGSGAHSGGGPAFAGSALAVATCLSRSTLRGGGVLHLARTPGSPGSCHACRPLPRGWLEDGPWAAAATAAETKSSARAIRDLISSELLTSLRPSPAGHEPRRRWQRQLEHCRGRRRVRPGRSVCGH